MRACTVIDTTCDVYSVFDGDGASNEDVFVAVGKTGVEGVLLGYNSTIFMYGQTGTLLRLCAKGSADSNTLHTHLT